MRTTSNGREQLTGGVFQESGNINVLTAQLKQTFTLGVLNWENVLTYQNSSNKDVLPLPDFNIFTNLFLKFKVAKVLLVELGGCATYFTNTTHQTICLRLDSLPFNRTPKAGWRLVDIPL